MVFIVALLLMALSYSLSTEESYNQLYNVLHLPWVKFITWLCLSIIVYHFLAGLKHLLMDVGFAEGKESGRVATIVLFVLVAVVVLFLGAWMIW